MTKYRAQLVMITIRDGVESYHTSILTGAHDNLAEARGRLKQLLNEEDDDADYTARVFRYEGGSRLAFVGLYTMLATKGLKVLPNSEVPGECDGFAVECSGDDWAGVDELVESVRSIGVKISEQ